MRAVAGSWIRFACCSVVLSVSLAACGGGDSGVSTSAQTSPPPSASPPPSTPPSTSPPLGAANAAPTIAGSAQTSVLAGQAYEFKPTASDADQDAVTFTIANKPTWAAFDTTTGSLSGTPATTDVGTYAAIEIAATDGAAVTALPEFTITVTASTDAPATKSVALSWTPPTLNDDGSALTDLSGYKIHYGTASKNYTQSVELTNAGLTRYQLDSMPAGTMYIAMTAVNSTGAESDYSQEVTITLN